MKKWGIGIAAMWMCVGVLMAGSVQAGMKAGAFTISPMAGGYIFDSERDLLDAGKTFSLALGYNFTENLAAELGFSYIHTDADVFLSDDDVYGYQPRVDLIYHFLPESTFVPYVAVGASYLIFDDDEVTDPNFTELEDTFQANAGVGLKVFVFENVALRADARYLYGFEDGQHEAELTAGLVWQFGGTEKAPDPCTLDADKDGVADCRDKCPDTTAGVRVDADGCQVKSTPYTGMEKSGESGRSLAKSDATPEPEMMQVVIYFDFNKVEIKQVNHKRLETLADFMKRYPDLTAIIEGHTDNVGSDKYNEKLSLKRAKAVQEFMTKTHGLGAERFELKAKGESQPAEPNTTAEGRKMNRRAIVITVK